MTFERTEIDGVPVFWVAGSEPLTAHLVFRVGVRDETFMTTGITHLVEHLTMSAVQGPRHGRNATVEPSFTSFMTTGKADAVATFIADVCAKLAAPELDRLPVEKKILSAEGGMAAGPVVAGHIRYRYGLKSVGLVGVVPPALNSITEEQVLAHIRNYFTAGNAALVLSGPPPEGLRIPLPQGPRRAPAPQERVALPLPMWFEQPAPLLGLSFEVPATTNEEREAACAMAQIACERAHAELRQKNGWIYDIDFTPVFQQDGTGIMCFEADPPPEHFEETRLGLLRILRELRDNGPTRSELDTVVESWEGYDADPAGRFDALTGAARYHLLDVPSLDPAGTLALLRSLGPSQCQESLGRLDQSLLIGVPEGVWLQENGLNTEQDPQHAPIKGQVYRRSIRGTIAGLPGSAQLVIGDEGISLTEGNTCTVRWEDVVGAQRFGDGTLLVIADKGYQLPIRPAWYAKGKEAVQFISAKLGEHMIFEDEAVPVAN
ncbi:insulinase family protein [Arthrobacter silvisoli]|uniref:insulinase family protein n=1 Tax=Arthrobacter silvisoli TaxID=2291022 RepID=UPI00144405F1|nr:insulinase family protein [Arthrobacter silvisoli]